MAKGWKPIVIADELYEACREYYEKNKKELKVREGVRSVSAFIAYCIREYMKDKGII